MSDQKQNTINDKPNCEVCPYNNCLIQHCTADWIAFFNKKKRTQRYSKKQHIFYEGNDVNGVYFVCQGIVKVYKNGLQDKSQIIRFSKEGEILGHRGWRKEKLPISAAALTDTVVCFISNDDFEEVLRNNPPMVFALMEFYSDELFQSEVKMKNLSLLNVYEKVAESLLTLERRFGVNDESFINIVMSRKEIAEYAGTTEKQVSKILSEFASEGIINLKVKQIGIVNHDYLKSLLKGNILLLK